MTTENPYSQSCAVAKLKERLSSNLPLNIVFSDLDSTVVAYSPPPETNKVRALLEQKEFAVVFVTSKTEEIIISEKEQKASPAFSRPKAHMGTDDKGKRLYIPPEQAEPEGILDADIVAGSSGTAIYVKQVRGGYIKDSSYLSSVKLDPVHWRQEVLEAIRSVPVNVELNDIEYAENYEKNLTDVYPPDYRVEVHLPNEGIKSSFVKQFMELSSERKLNLQLVDDSFPKMQKFSVYISPASLSKHQVVNWVINSLCTELEMLPASLNVFIFGDSFPDLKMGLQSAAQSPTTFLLAGGSPLSKYLTDSSKTFANENLQEIKKNLIPSKIKGFYQYNIANQLRKIVIIGDQAFPGTKGPETILAYLEQS